KLLSYKTNTPGYKLAFIFFPWKKSNSSDFFQNYKAAFLSPSTFKIIYFYMIVLKEMIFG
ncbi:hypothetical protein ACJX0J_026880, partial [Zea mays]